MKPRLLVTILLACAAPAQAQHEHAAPQIGTVDFAVSCTRPAQARFNHAVARGPHGTGFGIACISAWV